MPIHSSQALVSPNEMVPKQELVDIAEPRREELGQCPKVSVESDLPRRGKAKSIRHQWRYHPSSVIPDLSGDRIRHETALTCRGFSCPALACPTRSSSVSVFRVKCQVSLRGF